MPESKSTKSTKSTKGGGEPRGHKGRRRPLKKPLKEATSKKGKGALEEFYCLTCKGKRKAKNVKHIKLQKTKNGRDQAVADCSGKDCKRKLYKFLSKEDADRIRKLNK